MPQTVRFFVFDFVFSTHQDLKMIPLAVEGTPERKKGSVKLETGGVSEKLA